VAAVLWAQRAAVEQDAARVSSFEVEMARLSLTTSPTDVSALVERARRAVTGQAERRGIRLHTTLPQPGMVVSTDPLLAEQALITLFSHVVGQAQSDVAITLAVQEGGALLKLCYEPESSAGAPGEAAVERLLDRLGWVVYREEGTGHRYEVGVRIRPAGPIVLIVDDNMGLINLLQRYLVNHACRVIGAQSGAEGLRLAQELRPAVILLDVMMPGMHGWDVLQRLHNDPHTADIPVIVCSVLPNPDLALSLGAALFLPKPVRQEDVLNALRQLGIV